MSNAVNLTIGLNVADSITSPSGLVANSTFVSLSRLSMTVGPVNGMPSRDIPEIIAANTQVEVWVNKDSVQDNTVIPITTYPFQVVLTPQQTAEVYDILYGALAASYSNATPVYYSASN